MFRAEDLKWKAAGEAFGRLLDAVPKGKKALVFADAALVEATYNRMAQLLMQIRQMWRDQHGEAAEELPLLKLINGIVD